MKNIYQGLRDELFPKEKREELAGEESGQEAVLEGSEVMRPPFRVLASLSHWKMEVDVQAME